jgi:TolA-binding protein
VLAALASVACGTAPALPPAYERPLRVAEGLERDGRHAEAADAYARAAAGCGGHADRCATALVREARERESAGDAARARELYEAAARRHPTARDAPRALRRAARLRLAAGDVAGARTTLVHVVTRWPDHGETSRALAMLLQSYADAQDHSGALAVVRALSVRVGRTQIGDNLLLEHARLEEGLGRHDVAERTLERLVERHPYPAGSWDEALWMLADLREARGDARAAIRALEALVAVQEDTSFVGSYNLDKFDDAELRIARLWLESLRDPARAVAAAARLRRRYPDSVLRDDAVLLEARAELERGRRARACELRDTLREVDRFSRYLRPGRWPLACN